MDLKTMATKSISMCVHPSEDPKQASENDYIGVL